MISDLHHVQLAIPEGGEQMAASFYGGLLGLEELPKPPGLEARGGCWFRSGRAEIHLGVDPDFRPARKAHPALVTDDLEAMRRRIERAGIPVVVDEPLPGFDRFYVTDPFGNRIELLQPIEG